MSLTIPPDLEPWFLGFVFIAVLITAAFLYTDPNRKDPL